MEFDDVYLLDCQKNQLQSPADKNRLYVAATRAKETLTFVFNCSYYQSTPILDIIKENEECFDMEKR
jgi:superfamily I DNA/RNA helicase